MGQDDRRDELAAEGMRLEQLSQFEKEFLTQLNSTFGQTRGDEHRFVKLMSVWILERAKENKQKYDTIKGLISGSLAKEAFLLLLQSRKFKAHDANDVPSLLSIDEVRQTLQGLIDVAYMHLEVHNRWAQSEKRQ